MWGRRQKLQVFFERGWWIADLYIMVGAKIAGRYVMRNRTLLVGCLSAALLPGATVYKIQARYPVPGTGGWDYVTLDGAARRIYISHATQVDVLDADSGKVVGTIPDTPGVHGIAIAPAFKHGFTSNGREYTVST